MPERLDIRPERGKPLGNLIQNHASISTRGIDGDDFGGAVEKSTEWRRKLTEHRS